MWSHIGKYLIIFFICNGYVFCDEEAVINDDTMVDTEKGNQLSMYMVATKKINSKAIAPKVPFTVIYTIYNIGKFKIQSVKLTDTSFKKDNFIFKNGNIEAYWDIILPGERVTYFTQLEAKPHVTAHNVTAAIVTYYVESIEEKMTMRTSGHDNIILLDTSTYYKKNASHTIQWIVFALLVTLLLAGPYYGIRSLNKTYNLKSKAL